MATAARLALAALLVKNQQPPAPDVGSTQVVSLILTVFRSEMENAIFFWGKTHFMENDNGI